MSARIRLPAAFARRWASCLLLLLILLLVTFNPPHEFPPIRSDGFGYHIWTRALLEHDLSFCKYGGYPGFISRTDRERGVCQNQYPPGLALLRFPVMAPLVDRSPGAPAVSPAEHLANLVLSALALLGVCVLALKTARLLGARPWPAHAAVLGVVFGTGLFHYATFDASFTHVYSALGVALLVFLGARARSRNEPLPALLPALTAFFLVATRLTNLVVLAALAAGYWGWTGKPRSADLRQLVPVVAGAGVAVAMLMAYNRYAAGHFTASSYGQLGFLLDRPMQLPLLLSYERGLLTYYPVTAFVLIAGSAVAATRRAALFFTILISVYAGMYGFWYHWPLGQGFGHRGFVELMPVAIVLFAVALSRLQPRLQRTVLALSFVCVFATLELMVGYWTRTFPWQGAIPEIYWSHVLGPRSLPARALERF
jgi:hypothetical protein